MTGNTALDVGALFTGASGISSPIYLPWGRTLRGYDPGRYTGVTTILDAEAKAYNWMGTPVIGTFTPNSNKQYSTYNPGESCGTMNMANFPIPYATIVSFSCSMNCSKTKVLDIHGTVKEVHGLDDWKINIRGFYITGRNRKSCKTVAEQVNAPRKFHRVTGVVGVTGGIFNNKKTCPIVTGNILFNPVQGNSSVIPLIIKATNDNPYELTL